MSERPMSVEELFLEERQRDIPVAALNRRTVSYVDLAPAEAEAVNRVFDSIVKHLRKVSPAIAADIEVQRSLALKMAGVAKATFPVRKNYQLPSVPGSLGVAPLFPDGLKYAATPSSTYPCYTDYATHTWNITFSATPGTAAYLLGSSAAFYRASPTTNQHSFVLIFNNGVIEVGSTPKAEQFQLLSEGKQDYGAYAVEPLVEVNVEPNKAIYQYPTPLGALWVDFQSGVRWSLMPREAGATATIKLLGMIFFEHDFFSTLKYVS